MKLITNEESAVVVPIVIIVVMISGMLLAHALGIDPCGWCTSPPPVKELREPLTLE
jgi:hypothetical protein